MAKNLVDINQEKSLGGKLVITLIIALAGNLVLQEGIHFVFYSIFSDFMSGINHERFWFDLFALVLIICGPLLLSLYLRPDWVGLAIGLAAPVLGVLVWFLSGDFGMMTFGSGLFSGIIMAVLLIGNGKIQSLRAFAGLGCGVVFGIGLSVLLQIGLKDINFSPVAILWAWLSPIFFVELFSYRMRWMDGIIWAVMMVLSPPIFSAIMKIYP